MEMAHSKGTWTLGHSRYAQQNVREFQTNKDKMKGLLGINYLVTVNKLLFIPSYLECKQYTGTGEEGIRNAMARTRFKDMLQNLKFFRQQRS